MKYIDPHADVAPEEIGGTGVRLGSRAARENTSPDEIVRNSVHTRHPSGTGCTNRED